MTSPSGSPGIVDGALAVAAASGGGGTLARGGDGDRLTSRVSPVVMSVAVHAALLAGAGFVTWTEVAPGSPTAEFDVRVVAEPRDGGPTGGYRFTGRDLADLEAARADPQQPAASAAPTLASLLERPEPNAPMERAAEGGGALRGLSDGGGRSELIGTGSGAGSRATVARVGQRERAGGSAVGSLWGVGGGERANSFVYVLDRSGSMQDTFHLLQRELIRAIGTLRAEQTFNVIWFSEGTCEAFAPRPVAATAEHKREAFAAVRRIVPGGRTEPYDAVRRAFLMKPDVMYLLSDGDFGEQNARVLEYVRKSGRAGRTRVNTILFVYDAGGEGEEVLRRIAELGGGAYKHVTEDDLGS